MRFYLYAFMAISLGAIAPAYAQQSDVTPPALVTQPAAKAKASAKPAAAPGPKDAPFDTKLPIEISSDNLEVLQKENKAIFKGNVIAVQGQVRLKSDIMIVHYKNNNAPKPGIPGATPAPVPPPPAAPAQPSGSPGEMGAITLIEVQGNVFVVTPEETAKGDNGDYHADTRLLHLFGPNVILTHDKNIMRGTALEYNLNTGRSVLTNDGKVVGSKNGGRVRSVFVPQGDDPNAKPAAVKEKKHEKPGATVNFVPEPVTPAGDTENQKQ